MGRIKPVGLEWGWDEEEQHSKRQKYQSKPKLDSIFSPTTDHSTTKPQPNFTTSTRKRKLSPSARVFRRDVIAFNPNGGLLKTFAANLFERAHGLNGNNREDNTQLFYHANQLTNCSAMSFYRLLYGHSYQDILEDLRAQVPGYPAKKKGAFFESDYVAQLDVAHLLMT